MSVPWSCFLFYGMSVRIFCRILILYPTKVGYNIRKNDVKRTFSHEEYGSYKNRNQKKSGDEFNYIHSLPL